MGDNVAGAERHNADRQRRASSTGCHRPERAIASGGNDGVSGGVLRGLTHACAGLCRGSGAELKDLAAGLFQRRDDAIEQPRTGDAGSRVVDEGKAAAHGGGGNPR